MDKNLEKELSIDFPNLFLRAFLQTMHIHVIPIPKKLLYRINFLTYLNSYMHKIYDLPFLIFKYLALNPHLI